MSNPNITLHNPDKMRVEVHELNNCGKVTLDLKGAAGWELGIIGTLDDLESLVASMGNELAEARLQRGGATQVVAGVVEHVKLIEAEREVAEVDLVDPPEPWESQDG